MRFWNRILPRIHPRRSAPKAAISRGMFSWTEFTTSSMLYPTHWSYLQNKRMDWPITADVVDRVHALCSLHKGRPRIAWRHVGARGTHTSLQPIPGPHCGLIPCTKSLDTLKSTFAMESQSMFTNYFFIYKTFWNHFFAQNFYLRKQFCQSFWRCQ